MLNHDIFHLADDSSGKDAVSFPHYRDTGIDYIFLARNYHILNEILPFYKALQRETKYLLLADLPLNPESLKPAISRKRQNALIFATSWKDVLHFPYHTYSTVFTIRIFHGICGPWANSVRSSDPWDVVMASSALEFDAWRINPYKTKVAIVGWPKGEEALKIKDTGLKRNSLIIGSSWNVNRGAFHQYDAFFELNVLQPTFLLHPNLLPHASTPLKGKFPIKVVSHFLEKAAAFGFKIHDGSEPVLYAMSNHEVMCGVVSSTSFEWLLFNRPIVFLRNHPFLDFGPVIRQDKPIEAQILSHRDNEPNKYKEKRERLRSKVASHLDGKWHERFHEIIATFERKINFAL